MPDYTVTAVHGEPEKDTYGNVSYFVTLEGIEKNALLKHKGDRPVKAAGDVLQGYKLEEKKSQSGNSYLRLFREQNGGGGGGGGGRGHSPEERESIERQVAAKVASDLLVALMAQGTFKPEGVVALGDAHTRLAATVAGGIKQ